jgi:hypothetical protein
VAESTWMSKIAVVSAAVAQRNLKAVHAKRLGDVRALL